MRQISYTAHRDVNLDQWSIHADAKVKGNNYPPENPSDDPLWNYYGYWSEGNSRGRWEDGQIWQDMGTWIDVETARGADGATAGEVLAALKEREQQISDAYLRADYRCTIASLESALAEPEDGFSTAREFDRTHPGYWDLETS